MKGQFSAQHGDRDSGMMQPPQHMPEQKVLERLLRYVRIQISRSKIRKVL
jgi:hypothetical protein